MLTRCRCASAIVSRSLLLGLPALGGCAPPPAAIAPVVASQKQAVAVLAESAALDHALLRTQAEHALGVQRTILAGRVHRDLLARGLLTPDGRPDADALERDLADPAQAGALPREIREGRMTREQARAWLADYALALRMADPAETRARLLGRLADVQRFDASARSLLAAFDRRAEETRRLFAELDNSGRALADFAAFRPDGPATARRAASLLAAELAARIDDPSRRAAAEELIRLILAAPAPAGAPINPSQEVGS
ncbi:MAG: hypothetical protein IBJ11_10095 [Phycisphaerales bacterium]|nr:hypothetical protein [Phycisphaerales bacterium]